MLALWCKAPSASLPLTQVKPQRSPLLRDLLIPHRPKPFFRIRAESPHVCTSQTAAALTFCYADNWFYQYWPKNCPRTYSSLMLKHGELETCWHSGLFSVCSPAVPRAAEERREKTKTLGEQKCKKN